MKKYVLIFCIITMQILTAQSFVSSADSISIDEQLDSHFGVDYQIEDIIFVDSLENNVDYNREIIDDEYGTLDNCIVFIASIKDLIRNVKGVVGVYRNNQIIWYSEYIEPDDEIYGGNFIKVITDNNNNLKVEIMTEWAGTGGASYGTIRLFVHEWDGNQGVLVGDAYCHEYKRFKYIDIQGDGAFEIISFEYIDNKPTIFEWNGFEYKYSVNELDSIETFFPRNNFTPIVSTSVKKENGSFTYEYSLKNSASSAQSINEFDVYGFDKYLDVYESIEIEDTTVLTNAPYWYGVRLGTSISWEGARIKPAEELTGFICKTNGLPKIGNAYLRGYNYQWAGDYGDNHSVDDYLRNSVIIKTIAAKLPPSPFVPKEFLDSLINHNNESFDLGWVKSEPTYNKYNTYLTNTKTALEQNNYNTARANLQSILTDVDVDSSSTLTSEAYALLKFNTDYLLTQIPEDETYPYLKVNFRDSEGNFILNGSLQYYDAGWKDAVNNGDGTFNVETQKEKVSLRMTYEGGNQQLDNVTVAKNTVTFSTIKTIVKLLNSQNSLIDGGIVQYYASGWKEFGTATNGETAKELLPKNYSFRVNSNGVNKEKQQDITNNNVVEFVY